jgi:hypothetical protein
MEIKKFIFLEDQENIMINTMIYGNLMVLNGCKYARIRSLRMRLQYKKVDIKFA